MKKCRRISEEFKITNIKVANYAEIHPLKMQIVGLDPKFLLAMTKKAGKSQDQCTYYTSK
jgi:hypothetical protein